MTGLTKPHDQEWEIVVWMMTFQSLLQSAHLTGSWRFPVCPKRGIMSLHSSFVSLAPIPHDLFSKIDPVWQISPGTVVLPHLF